MLAGHRLLLRLCVLNLVHLGRLVTGIIALLCDVLPTLADGYLVDDLRWHTLRGSIAKSLRVYVLLRPD